MKRVVLECRGRLANQILCWANARHVLGELGLTDRLIVINYPIPPNCVRFPGAVVERVNPCHLSRVTRDGIAGAMGNCLWTWEDVYHNFPSDEVMQRIIQSIELEASFSDQLNNTINHDRFVGIHARFGDFVSIDRNNPPASLPPFIRGSNEYFLNAMEACRSAIPDVMFFLASDGADRELEFLTQGRDVGRGWPNQPLFDLFALARCRIIIGSASTFSSVAAQYGNVPWSVPTMSEAEIAGIIQASLQ